MSDLRRVLIACAGGVALLCLAGASQATIIDFTYTQTDASTGAGTISGDIDASSVGATGVLTFSGVLPVATLNQKDTTTVPVPAGMVGFMNPGGSDANPGANTGLHLGWTGSVTLSATEGTTTYLVDVPLRVPATGQPYSYQYKLTDDNSGAGGTNDAVNIHATEIKKVAGWIGENNNGHRHTGNTVPWAAGTENFTTSQNFTTGVDAQGDLLGITVGNRGPDEGTLTGVVFADEVTFSGKLDSDDNTLRSSGPDIIGYDTSDYVMENSAESVTLAGFTIRDNANRTLVATVGGERGDAIASLTFGGEALTQAAISDDGSTHASVWYLDLADTGGSITGDLVLTWSGSSNGFYLGAISLHNVKPGGPVDTDDGGNDVGDDITLVYPSASAGDMIVESAAGQSGTITAPAGLGVLYNANEGGGGGYSAAAGRELISDDGSESNTWQYALGSGPRARAAGALFTVVPEPSTLAVVVLGLVGVGARRRRRR